MPLTLYYHPLASFCHKVLIPLYEANTSFDPQIVDLMDSKEHAKFLDVWPVGKMPVLHDSKRDEIIPETSIIIEYLDRHYPGEVLMLPPDPQARLNARLWDRFFDLYVQDPMSKLVVNRIRPDDKKDAAGVEDAKDRLMMAYSMIEKNVSNKEWSIESGFSIADCAAAPALFYAGIIVPFPNDHSALRAYFERLLERPSFKKVLSEAQPYFENFPFYDDMPKRFLR